MTASRTAAVLLASVVGCGCGGTRMTQVLAYAPDGVSVMRQSDDYRLERYDLVTNRVRWSSAPVAAEHSRLKFARFSPNGAFLVAFRDTSAWPGDSWSGCVTAWEANSGTQLAKPLYGFFKTASRTAKALAISDDGRWLAHSLLNDLSVHDLTSQSSAAVPPDLAGVVGVSLAFAPDDARLGVLGYEGEFFVLAANEAGFTELFRSDSVRDFVWVGPHLVLLSSRGLELWDGRELVLLEPGSGKEPKEAHLVALQGGQRGLVAASLDSRITVFDLATRTWRFTRSDLGTIKDAVQRGQDLVVVARRADYETFVVTLALADGRLKHEKGLGAAAETKHAVPFIYPGGPSSYLEINFYAHLLPHGRFVDLADVTNYRHEFRELEK